MDLLKKQLNLLSSAIIIFTFALVMTTVIVHFSWRASKEMEKIQNERLEIMRMK